MATRDGLISSVSRCKRRRRRVSFLPVSVKPEPEPEPPFFLYFSSQHTVSVTQLVMMALQLSSSVTTTTTPSSSSIRSHNYSVQRSLTAWSLIRKSELSPSKNGNLHSIGSRSRRMRSAVAVVVKCSSSGSLDTEEAVVNVGQVTEVDKDTFWPIVKAAGDKPVVLDMYTQWCGPCKIIAPKYVELSEKYVDVVFLKLDCNQENKALAKELGIRVVPTFKILKKGSVVKEVTGAKFDDLVVAIDTVRSSG